ncbi:hypothetical protein RvY_04878 [Ramazzottius varieornatus]|uniref:Uncharacterized protein n=1 Tax=Ramazzottius varieornatus TaxID=947166 RepID=A0A1D1UTR7_RAMVA|nr:hypothetical protein RvY_04878 [Ramazzottius varieornatus]
MRGTAGCVFDDKRTNPQDRFIRDGEHLPCCKPNAVAGQPIEEGLNLEFLRKRQPALVDLVYVRQHAMSLKKDEK